MVRRVHRGRVRDTDARHYRGKPQHVIDMYPTYVTPPPLFHSCWLRAVCTAPEAEDELCTAFQVPAAASAGGAGKLAAVHVKSGSLALKVLRP